MKYEISLEFVTNMFGSAEPHVKQRLQAVIDNPCQETWDKAHNTILTREGRMKTLWQAVLEEDPKMSRSKPCGAPWPYIPSSETIKNAIRAIVMKQQFVQN